MIGAQSQVWCKRGINHSHPLDLHSTVTVFMHLSSDFKSSVKSRLVGLIGPLNSIRVSDSVRLASCLTNRHLITISRPMREGDYHVGCFAGLQTQANGPAH
jgi:hypothetical protein